MIKSLYAVRDSKTGWMLPTEDLNDESAKRNFLYACSTNPGIIAFAPADYSLYRIGTYDTDSGKLTNLDSSVYLCCGADAFTSMREFANED